MCFSSIRCIGVWTISARLSGAGVGSEETGPGMEILIPGPSLAVGLMPEGSRKGKSVAKP